MAPILEPVGRWAQNVPLVRLQLPAKFVEPFHDLQRFLEFTQRFEFSTNVLPVETGPLPEGKEKGTSLISVWVPLIRESYTSCATACLLPANALHAA